MATIASAHAFGVAAKPALWRAWMPFAGLCVFCGVLFFVGLGDRDLTSSHEARAAQNAQTILDEGHWLVPRLFDQHLELQKPPLYYWLVALFAWLHGGIVDAWAVRLPAALSGLGCVLFIYWLGVRSGRPTVGLFAAIILASSLHFTWLARVGRIDMPLTFAITVALGSFHLGKRWHVLGYVALGLGLLLKGPIAVVLPIIVSAAVWIWQRWLAGRACDGAGTGTGTLWWGIPLTLAIAAPWYIWANIRTDNQLWEVFFWYHNVERGLGGSETLKAHPWWFYVPQAGFDLLPWTLLVPIAVYRFFRNREIRQDDAASGGLIWFGAIALFLSCMSFKRADYLLPAFPGMAIFLASVIERWWQRRYAWGLAAFMAAYVIGYQTYLVGFAQAEEQAHPYQAMAEQIRAETQGPVIFFRAESHLLMHHVGQPVATILEWENLEWWTRRPKVIYFVMPEACADELPQHLPAGTLHEVLRTRAYATGRRDRPMVVLRTQPYQ